MRCCKRPALLLEMFELLFAVFHILLSIPELPGNIHKPCRPVGLVKLPPQHLVFRNDLFPFLHLGRHSLCLLEFCHDLAGRIPLFLAFFLDELQGLRLPRQFFGLLLLHGEHSLEFRLVFSTGLCEIDFLLFRDALIRFADFRGLSLELLVDFRVEEDLHDVLARTRIGHKETAEFPLRQQHDLTELLALKAQKPHNARMNLAVLGP